ncbi:MAG: hypothetical protein HC902_11555 [Calothrix sp. SM1_5_4]|nr:hypothetical protein [Calothrix sp. SM1_5_4]
MRCTRRLILTLLMVFGRTSVAGLACDQDTVIINLAFKYEGANKISGVESDVENLKSLYSGQPNVHTLYLDPAESDKRSVLEKIRKAIGNHKNVIFNYAGHGLTQKVIRKGMKSDELVVYTKKSAEAYRKNEPPPEAPLEKKSSQPSGGFMLAGQKCMSCRKEAEVLCVRDCYGRKVPNMADEEMKMYRNYCIQINCQDSSTNPRLADCYQQTCITGDDLSGLFHGRKVTGMIDACHSGGIALKGVDYSFLVSAGLEMATAKGRARSNGEGGGILTEAALAACASAGPDQAALNSFDILDAKRRVDPTDYLAHHFSGGAGDPDASCIVPVSKKNCGRQKADTPEPSSSPGVVQ